MQPGTKAPPQPEIETVESNPNAITTESKLVAGPVYTPVTTEERIDWWARRSFTLDSLAVQAANTAIKTWWWWNTPEEWGRGLDGFAKRYGTRNFEAIAGNGIEAAVGTLWGEDPRYFRSPDQRFTQRIRHAIISGVLDYRRDGSRGPAYARFIGIIGSRSISNQWYPDRDNNWWRRPGVGLGMGIAGRMGSNLFREFRPDLLRRVLKKK